MKLKNILDTTSQHIVTAIISYTWKSLSQNSHPFKLTCTFSFVCVQQLSNFVLKAFFICGYPGRQIWPISRSIEFVFWHWSCGAIGNTWVEINIESVIFKTQLPIVHYMWHLYVNSCFICNIIFMGTLHQGCWWKILWRNMFVKAIWQFKAVKFHWLEYRVLRL